jgi:hypothetical protein
MAEETRPAADPAAGAANQDMEQKIPHSAEHLANHHQAVSYAAQVAHDSGHAVEHPQIRKLLHKDYGTLAKMANCANKSFVENHPDFEPLHDQDMPEVHPAAKKPGQPEVDETKPESAEKKPGEEKPDKDKPRKDAEERAGEQPRSGQKSMEVPGTTRGEPSLADHGCTTDTADYLESVARYHPNPQERDVMMGHAKRLRAYHAKMCGKDMPMETDDQSQAQPMMGENMDEKSLQYASDFMDRLIGRVDGLSKSLPPATVST